jgi:hypothetical protein
MQIALDVGLRPRPSESSFGVSSFLPFLFLPQYLLSRRNCSVVGIAPPATQPQPQTMTRRFFRAGAGLRAACRKGGVVKHPFEQDFEFDRFGFAEPLNSPGRYGRAAVVGLSCYFS